MIVDFHVHVFPPEIKADRSRWLASDATFAELYQSPKARVATAEDVLRSMDTAGIDISVMQGFAWTDPEACCRHNDVLLEAAARYPDRLVAYCTLSPSTSAEAAGDEAERCVAAGGRGFGELRPDGQGYSGRWECLAKVASVASASGTPLLVHASEPVGHLYPGKGAMDPAELMALVRHFPGVTWVLAHLGGGLPFYAAMPEVREALRNVYVDTAAWSLLYGPQVFAALSETMGSERILFASDFPLQAQGPSVERMRQLPLDSIAIEAMLGGNAGALLRRGDGR